MIYFVIRIGLHTTVGRKNPVKRRHSPFTSSMDLEVDTRLCRSPVMSRGKYFWRYAQVDDATDDNNVHEKHLTESKSFFFWGCLTRRIISVH